jgi:phosphatidylglycerol:prolipoprotein diacylglycerol transferase
MHPILLKLGPLTIPTYGAIVAAGWLAGVRWLVSRRDKLGLSEDEVWTMLYWVFGGAFVGGKVLYYAVINPSAWEWSLNSLRYGSVFYGGFIGSLVAGLWLCRRRGWSFVKLSDYAGAACALGHGIGRFGCLAAGCCYGRHTDLPWGIPLAGDPSRHPTQVYEALLNFVLFLFLARVVLPRVESGRWRRGSGIVGYALGYAALRFFVELFRGDDRGGTGAGLSPSQWIAVAVTAAAVAAYAVLRSRAPAEKR